MEALVDSFKQSYIIVFIAGLRLKLVRCGLKSAAKRNLHDPPILFRRG